MMAGSDEEGGEVETSSGEYCSLSECIVTPDSAIGFEGSSEAMMGVFSSAEEQRLKMRSRPRSSPWLVATGVCCSVLVWSGALG